MAQAKYKQYYQQMIEENEQLFEQFAHIHVAYENDKEKHQKEFHSVGQELVDLLRDWDRRLCSAMGKGMYSVYSQKLSEKFWDLAREDFPLIDFVGVKIKKAIS